MNNWRGIIGNPSALVVGRGTNIDFFF